MKSQYEKTRKFSKADNQRVSYAFTSSPFSFHACHILPAFKFQYSYSCIDSAPARSLLFFVVDSVCMYVCNAPSNRFFFFVSRWNPAISWPSVLMTKTTERCSSNFDLLPWQRNLGYFCKNFKLLLLLNKKEEAI